MYGANSNPQDHIGPPQGVQTQQSPIIQIEFQDQDELFVKKHDSAWFPMIKCSECTASTIFVISLLIGYWGVLVAAVTDQRGFNFKCFKIFIFALVADVITAILIRITFGLITIGHLIIWIWAACIGCKIYSLTQKRFR